MIAPIYPMYVRDADKKIMYDEHGNKIYDSGVNTNQIRSFSGGANPMISIDLDRHRTYTDAINGNWFATVTPARPGAERHGQHQCQRHQPPCEPPL